MHDFHSWPFSPFHVCHFKGSFSNGWRQEELECWQDVRSMRSSQSCVSWSHSNDIFHCRWRWGSADDTGFDINVSHKVIITGTLIIVFPSGLPHLLPHLGSSNEVALTVCSKMPTLLLWCFDELFNISKYLVELCWWILLHCKDIFAAADRTPVRNYICNYNHVCVFGGIRKRLLG